MSSKHSRQGRCATAGLTTPLTGCSKILAPLLLTYHQVVQWTGWHCCFFAANCSLLWLLVKHLFSPCLSLSRRRSTLTDTTTGLLRMQLTVAHESVPGEAQAAESAVRIGVAFWPTHRKQQALLQRRHVSGRSRHCHSVQLPRGAVQCQGPLLQHAQQGPIP